MALRPSVRARLQPYWPVVPPVALLFAAVLASVTGKWKFFVGNIDMNPVFADLRAVTSTASCMMENPDWTMDSPSCDPFGRPYNYPTLLPRILAFLGLGYSLSGEIGVALIFLLVGSLLLAVIIVGVRGWMPGSVVVWSAFCFSPPVLLLLERGNSDIFVIALLAVAATLISLEKRGLWFWAAGILVFATQVKLFPVGGFLGLLGPGNRQKILTILAILFSATLVLVNFTEWFLVVERTPSPTLDGFGAAVLPHFLSASLGFEFGGLALRAIGFALTLATVLAILLMTKRSRSTRTGLFVSQIVNGLASDRRARALFISGAGPLVFVYLVGSSWDYRLTLIGLPVLAVLRLRHSEKLQSPGFALGAVGSMWLSYNVAPFAQIAGDIFLLVLVSVILLILARLTLLYLDSREQNPELS